MSKIILDLCGGTGSWSKPYRDAGYDVRLVTLPEFDVCSYKPPENVYGILAAPPCTMFSIARTRAKKPRDFYEGMRVVAACLEIIWACQIAGRLKFWALENPRGMLRKFLGKPAFCFQPWEFGEESFLATKRTEIWGHFKEPKKTVGDRKIPFVRPFKRRDCPPRLFPLEDREVNDKWGFATVEARAKTPPVFAQAFFLANR